MVWLWRRRGARSPLSLSQYAMRPGMYNHRRVTVRNFSWLFMDHRLNFEGGQAARSRIDYGFLSHTQSGILNINKT